MNEFIQGKELEIILKKKMEEGCLFLHEKYLDALPYDYHDAFMFIYSNGIDQRKDCGVIIFDDDETEKLFKCYELKSVPIFIIPEKEIEGKRAIWQIVLEKEFIDGDPDPKPLFIGTESFRTFCDERNIFYKSMITSDNKLLSGSNLRYQKKDGEDCRKPENEKEVING